jgi:aryl-alcohol dehydrogenase-like predicted oxidoreductase
MTTSRNLRTISMQLPCRSHLAWLFKRSKVILPIPGTSSIKHLEENIGAAGLELPPLTTSCPLAILP